MLPAVKKWTKETWELDGAQYQETLPFNAAQPVWEKERKVHPRVPVPKQISYGTLIFPRRQKSPCNSGGTTCTRATRLFLRDRVYPLLKEVVTFYVGTWKRMPQGRYNIWPSNAHETFLEGKESGARPGRPAVYPAGRD